MTTRQHSGQCLRPPPGFHQSEIISIIHHQCRTDGCLCPIALERSTPTSCHTIQLTTHNRSELELGLVAATLTIFSSPVGSPNPPPPVPSESFFLTIHATSHTSSTSFVKSQSKDRIRRSMWCSLEALDGGWSEHGVRELFCTSSLNF